MSNLPSLEKIQGIVKEYHVNPKSVGWHWDGKKCTYFSLEHGKNKIICNRESDEPVWEVVICIDSHVLTEFVKEEKLQDCIVALLKDWDSHNKPIINNTIVCHSDVVQLIKYYPDITADVLANKLAIGMRIQDVLLEVVKNLVTKSVSLPEK